MARTQAEALAKKTEANTKKVSTVQYLDAIAPAGFWQGMSDYDQACHNRDAAVHSSLSEGDKAFVDTCLAELDACFAPALSKFNQALTEKGSGNADLGTSEMAYSVGQWDTSYDKAASAITHYGTAVSKGTETVTILDNGRENGIQANARINAYNLAHPTPDPGDPIAPEPPAAP